ncbi:carbohydrate-binding module family 13 protein [Rhizophagus clarus]|uniref:Carbohydrate-binding module family 13 protein n=1 Tax=Rhizophagus clarus TaxID=94130 RepID=A0A8H3QRB0_9GLOM|nr:carbohydrate-binding module family 13 protein [Rhizophagus clarus]
MVDSELLPKLSQNLLEILNDEEYYDITIEVGNDPYLPNISPETFQIILKYIYGGKVSLNEFDNSDIIKVLVAAKELGLQELVTYSQSFLVKNKTDWMEQNFNLVYQVSFENDSFLELQKYCTDLMISEPNKIFNSINFSSIPEKLLISIIQNDNLQISEVQVWDHVLKWGIAQNPELPSDVTNYSDDDFNTLKNTLQQCIPFIRFYNLTSKEFLDKILPYEQILPKELYKDLLIAFISLSDPNSKPSDKSKPRIPRKIDSKNINSKIITFQHAELISKWIDRLEITDMLTSSYEFKLLFRGSRDGFNSRNFHKNCDNKPRTVTIIKVGGSSEILGGYNPLEWKSNDSFMTTKDSFIFSFDNSIGDYILSRVANENRAVFNSSDYGPSFGKSDLIVWDFGDSYTYKSCYEKPIRKTTNDFIVEECEVFQIL